MKGQPSKIVIVCPNWVGDVVMAAPALECLRANFPKSYIYGLIRKYAFGVIEDSPWFDEILLGQDKSFRGFIKLILKIRKIRPEMAVVFPNSVRAALLMKCSGVNNIFGYQTNHREIFLTGGPHPVKIDNQKIPRPGRDYYLEICRWLQLELPYWPKPRLFVSKALQEKGQALLEKYGLEENDLVIGLNPGAKFGSSKCWPPEYFAGLAELLEKKYGCKLLLLVGPGEEQIAQEIVNQSRAQIINTGPDQVDLALLKPLIQACHLLVTNDTGPRHYAVAFDKPVVVIMGSTDPRYTAANLDKTIVVRKELSCSPCHKKICPYGHECMKLLKPQTVFEAVEKLIQQEKILDNPIR